MNFEKNKNWENMPTPSVGETVALHYFDGNNYKFEVKILSDKGKGLFSGIILSVHTMDGLKAQIIGGEILSKVLNKEHAFDRAQIFPIG